ncbi:MAG: ABC transporter ATP-binding protein [Treponema sp.]|nr:ABC transporter ATP-binding protein [Treponema sp.]
MIEVRNLVFGYGKKKNFHKIINNVSFTINDGEFVAIAGENGAGKSTLSKLISGLIKPVEGSVTINSLDTKKTKNSIIARQIGFLFQNPDRQLCCYTVKDEIAFGLKALHYGSEKEIEERTNEIIREFNFTPHEEPFALSRGQRQRLALASIIAVKPKIMILDEPTTGLDYKECMEIMGEIKKLNQKGCTVIMVCHDMELVMDFADRMILLSKGEVSADGKTVEIMQNRELLEKSSLLPPQIVGLYLELQKNHPDLFPHQTSREALTEKAVAAIIGGKK